MINSSYIAEIYQEAITTGAGKLTGNESTFLQSIYRISQLPNFTGLSSKQELWFNAIAKRLEATKGKLSIELIAERSPYSYRRYQQAYYTACMGW